MLGVKRSLNLHYVSKSCVLLFSKSGVDISIWASTIIVITFIHISIIKPLSSHSGFGCVRRIWVVTYWKERDGHFFRIRVEIWINSSVARIIIGISICCKTLTKCSKGLRAHGKVKLTCSQDLSVPTSNCCVSEYKSIPKNHRCEPITIWPLEEVVVIVLAIHSTNIGDVIVHSYVEHQNWISHVACKVSLENIPIFNWQILAIWWLIIRYLVQSVLNVCHVIF
jgi:hypothetical protein